MSICVILLAGGIGSRMKTPTPKQYLQLNKKPVILYSYDLFMAMPRISEVVVVASAEFQHHFIRKSRQPALTFAHPGIRRQDSVENGFQAITTKPQLVCIHDGVRPFITVPIVERAIKAAEEHGAATVGMPVKFTVKECTQEQLVVKTPDRTRIWEIQTPQIIQTDLLRRGLEHAKTQGLTVTDDVSMIELLGHPVKLVEGCYTNLKITTPDDLALSEYLLNAAK